MPSNQGCGLQKPLESSEGGEGSCGGGGEGAGTCLERWPKEGQAGGQGRAAAAEAQRASVGRCWARRHGVGLVPRGLVAAVPREGSPQVLLVLHICCVLPPSFRQGSTGRVQRRACGEAKDVMEHPCASFGFLVGG